LPKRKIGPLIMDNTNSQVQDVNVTSAECPNLTQNPWEWARRGKGKVKLPL